MKSDIYTLYGNGEGIEEALEAADNVAAYAKLGKKEALQLRLLAEELTGIMRGIVGDFEAQYWIEKEENTYQLHMASKMHLNYVEKDKLLDVSTSGENTVPGGVMAKIGHFFKEMIENYSQSAMVYPQADMMMYKNAGMVNVNMSTFTWSLREYKKYVKEEVQEREWDELEKSIVANLADDVSVCIDGKDIEIVIKKTFN